MDKRKIEQIRQQYDLIIHNIENADIEFWYARELMPLLGYERWENFDKTICRAMESCETSGITVSDHFRDLTKMVKLGSNAQRNIKDYMLTRYACYLIAQNGDPQKEEIAFAQSYFAICLGNVESNQKIYLHLKISKNWKDVWNRRKRKSLHRQENYQILIIIIQIKNNKPMHIVVNIS